MRKYGAAGGAGCLGQDFSIKCVVKNGWLRHLAASPSRQQWQFSRSTLTLFLLSRVFFFFFCACTDRLRAAAPPFVLCKFTQGLLDMLDAMGKKRNKRGGRKRNLFNKVGRAVLKAAANKGRAKLEKKRRFYTVLCTNNSEAAVPLRRKIIRNGQQSHCYLCIYKNCSYPFCNRR